MLLFTVHSNILLRNKTTTGDLMKKIYIDASTHPKKQISVGALILHSNGEKISKTYRLRGTNNHEAEFEMLIHALTLLRETNEENDTIFIYSDSRIVVDTFHKEYVKKNEFKPYLEKILSLSEDMPHLYLEWIPESENKMADHYAKQALHHYLKTMKI